MTGSNDVSHRFRLERAGVRGGFVRLEASWAGLCAHADHAPPVARLLGEALAASALFAGAIKFEGGLSVQLRSAGPLKLLFAECSHDGGLRGIARWDGGHPDAPIDLRQPDAQLAITIENKRSSTRYQGLVGIEAASLAEAFEGYFRQSEQLPTLIVLAVGAGRCGGLMLQQVADAGGGGSAPDPDAWSRVGHLLATLGESELLELPPADLLYRLFHEEQVFLEPARPLAFRCSCSQQRVTDMLRALGPEECEASVDADGVIAITCEFCDRVYRIDRVDLGVLFAAGPVPPAPQTAQ